MVWYYNETEKQLYIVPAMTEEFILGSLPSLPLCIRFPLLPFATGEILTTESETFAVLIPIKKAMASLFLIPLFPGL